MARNFKRNKHWLLLTAIFTFVICIAPLAQTQDQPADNAEAHGSGARIVRISFVAGEVRLDNGRGFESVTMNTPLTAHDRLQTMSDAWAEIQLEDGSLVRLAPDTQISFIDLARLSSGGTRSTLDLVQGEAEIQLSSRPSGEFQVAVKNKTIIAKQPGTFRVTSINTDPLEVVVWKGSVALRDPESGSVIAISKNETFVLDPSDTGHYALDKGAEADDLDQWNQQRESDLSSYASAQGSYAGSPYQYGTDDLNYYGQYYDEAGYGDLWQPNGVGSDWDPFSNGYWANTGGGYTWVSAYPWGWLPYRYGHWVFLTGRGWFWAPGSWNRWHNLPRIVNAPPNFRAPVPPVDTKIVGRLPGQVIRPGETTSNNGGKPAGFADERFANRDDDGQLGNQGNRHVFTNDDVARVPRTDVPAHTPQGTMDADRRPKKLEREPANNTGAYQHEDRFHGDREPIRTQMSRSNDSPSSSVSRPMRQSGPPPMGYSSPAREHNSPAREGSAPVRASTLPVQVPVVRQPTPPVVTHQVEPYRPAAPHMQNPPVQTSEPHSVQSGGSESSRTIKR
jgi:hypothetical protein